MAHAPRGMECSKCSEWVDQVGDKCSSVICSDCVQAEIPAPEIAPPIQRLTKEERAAKKEARKAKKKAKLEAMKTKSRGRGKGWHLKKLFMFEGLYFSFGKEISAVEASKLMEDLKKNPEGKPKRKYTKRAKV